jgi:hypothetical protein
LVVYVQHKPRGSKGVWQNVEPCQRLRVTKGKGKRLKLEILVNDPTLPSGPLSDKYRVDKIVVVLKDLENPNSPPTVEGFSVEVCLNRSVN